MRLMPFPVPHVTAGHRGSAFMNWISVPTKLPDETMFASSTLLLYADTRSLHAPGKDAARDSHRSREQALIRCQDVVL